MSNNFTCAICKKTYTKGQTDKEAEKEMKEMFGEHNRVEDCAIVCDDCYKRLFS